MGQKVNPHGLRVGIIKGWDTQWYADKKLVEDGNRALKKSTDVLYRDNIGRLKIKDSNGSTYTYIVTDPTNPDKKKNHYFDEMTVDEILKIYRKEFGEELNVDRSALTEEVDVEYIEEDEDEEDLNIKEVEGIDTDLESIDDALDSITKSLNSFSTYVWKDDTSSDMEYADVTSAMHDEIMDQGFNYFYVSGEPIDGGLQLTVEANDDDTHSLRGASQDYLGANEFTTSDFIDPNFTDYYADDQVDVGLFLSDYESTLKEMVQELKQIQEFLPKFAKGWGFKKKN